MEYYSKFEIFTENMTNLSKIDFTSGAKKIFDDLIEKGADVNAADEYGETPLHYAALNLDEYFVETLIKMRADVNKRDRIYGNTPLLNSALNSNLKVMELLLANGANISAISKDERTALHWAAYNRNEKVTELLIEKGIDVHAKCSPKTEPIVARPTALLYAMINTNEKVAELLINAGSNVNEGTSLMTPIFMISNNGMPVLKEHEPKHRDYFTKKRIELINEHSKNPVHENSIEKLFDLLIKNGADINREVFPIGTPLDLAEHIGNKRFVKVLIEHGARKITWDTIREYMKKVRQDSDIGQNPISDSKKF